MPTGADVAGTYSILSLSLSLCLLHRCVAPSLPLYLLVCVSLGLFFVVALTRWTEASLQTFLAQGHNAPSHVIQPAISSLSISFSLSLSIHKRPRSLFPSVLSPLTKADKGLSFLPSFLALCVFVLYQTRLPHSLYSLLLFAKKVSRGPGAPALRQGACLSPVREVAVAGGKGLCGE